MQYPAPSDEKDIPFIKIWCKMYIYTVFTSPLTCLALSTQGPSLYVRIWRL